MSETNAAVVERFLSAVQNLDVQAALGCLHPNVQVVEPASLPYGGTHTGVDGFMAIFTELTATASLSVPAFEVLDSGSVTVGRIQLLLKAHATGAELELPVIELYTVTDGLITNIDVYPKDTKMMTDFLSTGAVDAVEPTVMRPDQSVGQVAR